MDGVTELPSESVMMPKAYVQAVGGTLFIVEYVHDQDEYWGNAYRAGAEIAHAEGLSIHDVMLELHKAVSKRGFFGGLFGGAG